MNELMLLGNPLAFWLYPNQSRYSLWRRGLDDYAGCYTVWSPARVCLYVGRSEQLLTRVLSHYIDQRDGNGIQWRVTGSVERRRLDAFAPAGSIIRTFRSDDYIELEREMIVRCKPLHNRCYIALGRNGGNASL